NTMTMSNNSGSTNYVKLSIEDATGYYVYYRDEALYEQQQNLINMSSAEETAADVTETSDAETEAEETVSESTEQ
ncbi:MAG: hypothetical protein ACI4K7_04345, partial [Oscillospiraceae bacterium]